MTGDARRDREPTEHNFIGGEDNDYAAAKQAETEKAQPALVWCKHMDADVYEGTCAMCTPPEQEPTRGHAVAYTDARYDGACPACERGIREGDPLALIDGEWMHREHTEVGDA